jgi:hypothetical protein
MMAFAIMYRKSIDDVTANKKLKLCQFELDNDDWKIIEDLVVVLQVSHKVPTRRFANIHTEI